MVRRSSVLDKRWSYKHNNSFKREQKVMNFCKTHKYLLQLGQDDFSIEIKGNNCDISFLDENKIIWEDLLYKILITCIGIL